MARVRHLTIVLGDQLDHQSAAFDGFDGNLDMVWMAEVSGESTHVPSHKTRTALFLSCMRHFAEELREKNFPLEYRKLDAKDNEGDLALELRKSIYRFKPKSLVVIEPGEYRVEKMLREVANDVSIPLDIRPDRSFFCSREQFCDWAQGNSSLRMEFFYREMRRRSGVLMERAKPEGGRWNYDTENRKSFGKSGPGLLLASPRRFEPDSITRDVLSLVARTFPDNPGLLEHFDFPVTAKDAQLALDDFVEHRLPVFGDYQDAMWADEPYLCHSRISAMMNLKLLNPRRVLMAVEDAYHRERAPWRRSRATSGRYSDGESMSAVCIGSICRSIWKRMRLTLTNPCLISTGPATQT